MNERAKGMQARGWNKGYMDTYAKIQESSRTQNAGMRKHEQKKEERTVAECRSLNGYSEKTGIMFLST